MSPFQKNLQRLLIFVFTGASLVLVVMGITRSKASTLGNFLLPPQPDLGATSSQKTNEKTLTTTPATSSSKSYAGKTYQTPWGNVVAGIKVVNGRITGVTMPQVPNSPPSQYAEQYLVQQALTAGSANIQGVSGATYTSIAFKASLENAIAQANTQGQTITPGSSKSSNVTTPPARPSVPRRYRENDDD